MGKLRLATEEFLAYGYSFQPQFNSNDYCFIREFNKASGTYKVKFEISEDSFNSAPFPTIESLPDKLSNRRLPHLLGGKYCCLFSNTSVLDPLNIKQLISSWLSKMEEIIVLWESGDYHKDYLTEFGVYWGGISTYLLSDNSDFKQLEVYSFNRNKLDGDEELEYVIAEDREGAQQWAENRNATNAIEFRNDALFVKLTQAPFIHYDHPWPPKRLKDFSSWLLTSSNGDSVLEKVLSSLAILDKWSKNKITFVDVIFHYETIFFGVSFNLPVESRKALARNYAPKSKRGRGMKVREKLRKRIFEDSNSKVFPLNVIPASLDYILKRNSSNSLPLLANKKIALIGGGTIGGYLAHSLTQLGAGYDNGLITIFDNDVLKAGNLGRHILGISYVGEKKSESLKHYLKGQGFHSKVIARGKFSMGLDFSEFDLILDATGDQAFSLNLSHKVSRFRGLGGRILLAHSWISGFGHTAKSLLDNGISGCYGCQFDYSKKPVKSELYPSLSRGKSPNATDVFKRSCGENHLPFGSEASMLAASLVIQLLYDRQKKAPTLLIRRVSDKAIEQKDKRLKKRIECPACKS
jgi:hypothetical protein